MKSQHQRRIGWVRSLRTALAIWIVLVLATAVVRANTVDDFEDPARFDQVWTKQCWFGTCNHQITAEGQLRLAVTPTGDHGLATLRSVQRWTLQERHTTEFRVDLIRTSGDGAMVRLAFGYGDGTRGYILAVDEDSVALSKRDNTPVEMFFRNNDLPIKATNVKLVLSITGESEGAVLIQVRILDNEQSGRVIYAEDVRDTAGADPMAVGPDDPPGSYLGMSGIFHLAVYHDNAALIDPAVEIPPLSEAEVILDNAEVIEYASAWMAQPSTALLLTWPENIAEEQVVVGADSLTSSAWMPCPEPIYHRFGERCMPVPTIGDCQFWKLVPGTQFMDSFDPPKLPYVAKGDWMPTFANQGDSTRIVCKNVDGALRIYTVAPRLEGKVILRPPGPAVLVGDFYASVDILKWPGPGKEIGPWVRGTIDTDNLFNSNGYIASYSREHNKAVLWDGSQDHLGPSFRLDTAARHRLSFWGVGNNVSMRLLNLETGASVDHALTFSRWSQGPVALFIDTLTEGTFDITLDNFFFTGTKP